jgi:predicted transposase YbfD/YdcC
LFGQKQRNPEKTCMNYTELGPQQEVYETGLIYDLQSLFSFFTRVTDLRHSRGKQYPLALLLVLIFLAKLCGENTPSGIADWVTYRIEEFVEMKLLTKKKAPCHMTYRRVLQLIVSPEDMERLMSEYHQACLNRGTELVFSLDGKTVKGTIPSGETRGTHLLSLYVPGQGLVLTEAKVDLKENEIVVAPEILKQVCLEGVIVIGDAMHTQRGTSQQILQAGGEYVWMAKGNQARTLWAIQKLFVHEACNLKNGAPLSKDIHTAETINKGHGRREKRTIWTSTELNDYLKWPGVGQVFRIERVIWHEKHHGYTRHIVYGLTSLSPEQASPKKLLALVRQYWEIEAGLHYRRDVTLKEDATRLTLGNAGHIMAILNNAIIGLCLQNGYRNLAQARRLFNARPGLALNLLCSAKAHSC